MPPSLVRHNQAMPRVLPASGDRERHGRTSGKTDPNQCSPALFHHAGLMWNPIADTPYGRRLALAVIDKDGSDHPDTKANSNAIDSVIKAQKK